MPTEVKLRGRPTRDVLKSWLPENLYALCGLDAPIMVRPAPRDDAMPVLCFRRDPPVPAHRHAGGNLVGSAAPAPHRGTSPCLTLAFSPSTHQTALDKFDDMYQESKEAQDKWWVRSKCTHGRWKKFNLVAAFRPRYLRVHPHRPILTAATPL